MRNRANGNKNNNINDHLNVSAAAAAAAAVAIGHNNNQQSIVSEWEDNILFDVDDPDFCNLSTNVVVNEVLNTVASAAAVTNTTLNTLHRKETNQTTTTTTMSIASVHGPQFADICSPLALSSLSGLSASLPDLVGSPLEISVDNVLTIEELRQHMGSCFTCGVSWTDDHVSLDCSECGGYSMERPCPLCDGQCGVQWKRDFTMSHACSKARWVGVCTSYPEAAVNVVNAPATNPTAASCASAAANQLRLAQELCSRLEQLSTSSNSARI